MLLGGQKHHFLQDSVHSSKFCAVYQILQKFPLAQNRRILEGLINLSLSNGTFVKQWKTAIVWPLLKKSNLELLPLSVCIPFKYSCELH